MTSPAPRHRTYETLGILMRFIAFPEDVQNKFCLVEAVVPPGLGAPPNHHAGETETFYVIEGEVDFMVDGEPRRVGPGQSVIVPDGAVHAFTAVGERPARLLILNAPGLMHDRFFTGLGQPVPAGTTEPAPMAGPPDIAAVAALAAEVGMTLMPPQPA